MSKPQSAGISKKGQSTYKTALTKTKLQIGLKNYTNKTAPDTFVNAPNSITIQGVKFNKMGQTYKTVDKEYTRYGSDYQSTVQTNNGGYSIFSVVVKYKTKSKAKTKKYTYDNSSVFGTRVWG